MARVNILQTLVLFHFLIQIASDWFDKHMIEVTFVKAEAVERFRV